MNLLNDHSIIAHPCLQSIVTKSTSLSFSLHFLDYNVIPVYSCYPTNWVLCIYVHACVRLYMGTGISWFSDRRNPIKESLDSSLIVTHNVMAFISQSCRFSENVHLSGYLQGHPFYGYSLPIPFYSIIYNLQGRSWNHFLVLTIALLFHFVSSFTAAQIART